MPKTSIYFCIDELNDNRKQYFLMILPMNFKLTKSIGLSVLALMLSVAASAQNITVSGVVTDRSGETVIGEGTVIGANAFITASVPAGSRVSMKNQ